MKHLDTTLADKIRNTMQRGTTDAGKTKNVVFHIDEQRGYALMRYPGSTYYNRGANYVPGHIEIIWYNDPDLVDNRPPHFDIWDTGRDKDGTLTPTKAKALIEVINKTFDDLPCISIALAVCLLDKDSPLVSADVLTQDRVKLRQNPKDVTTLQEKAKKRGKFGWTIGSSEVSPHFRRPHLAKRHVGPGRKQLRIVSIDATMVHRRKITAVPTDYEE